MVRKCGFFDCSNPVAEEETSCQSCVERKEQSICSACRQPEPQENEVLNFRPSLLTKKYLYKMATIMRNKLPVQLQTEFDQLLPQLKLSASEQAFIAKAEKFLSDFLAAKGGKQDHIDWLLFCSVCDSEFSEKREEIFEIPQNKTLMEGINEKEKKTEEFFEDKRQAIGEEGWKKIIKESEEEFYKQIATNPNNNQPDQNHPDRNQPDRHKPPKTPKSKNNDNSVKINQLEEEIDKLKQEISNLKKPGNPTPPNNDTLRDKEKKLRDKETELKQLKETNSSSSNQKNSNLPLYIGISIGGIGIFFLIIALLVLQKKKKKKKKTVNNSITYDYSK